MSQLAHPTSLIFSIKTRIFQLNPQNLITPKYNKLAQRECQEEGTKKVTNNIALS